MRDRWYNFLYKVQPIVDHRSIIADMIPTDRDDVIDGYRAVWAAAERVVDYIGYMEWDGLSSGQYRTTESTIYLARRQKFDDGLWKPQFFTTDNEVIPTDVLRDEVVTLAHEYGHAMNAAAIGGPERRRWVRYYAALVSWNTLRRDNAQIHPDHRRMILEEEDLAWGVGRGLLLDLAPGLVTLLDTHRAHAARLYRKALDL